MNREAILAALALLILTAIGFLHFPGHTWLQSDTQIYVAILEHLWDPPVLARDMVATRPHVSYTIYDETAIGLRTLTGFGFREVLLGELFAFRALALWGVFLIARSLNFGTWFSVFVAGSFGLGAVINGPSVLTLEYEPIPRAFAVALIFLSIGLAAHRDWLWAGAAGGLAFLFHPPTSFPLWLVAGLFWIVLHRKREPVRILVPAAVSVAILFLLSRIQRGEREPQSFFSRIDAELEPIQKLRGAYNWIETWPADWFWQYPVLVAVVILAWMRLRASMTAPVQWLSLGLPLCGLASIAVSWMLLDWGKWGFIPQFQPARAVLFITAFAVILGACAGLSAASFGRLWESVGWFALVYAIPISGRLIGLFQFSDPLALPRLALVFFLAGVTVAAAWKRSEPGWRLAAPLALALLLIPTWGQVKTHPQLHTPQLMELAEWGKTSPRDSLFVFAGFGRDLAPGIFRATALRSIYVDWKGGGQANLLRALGLEWWLRWNQLRQGAYDPGDENRFAALGITHFVVPATGHQPAALTPLFRNARYSAYAVAR